MGAADVVAEPDLVVLNAGDVILRLLLFWSMLLPLGARWSLDAARAGRRPPDLVTGGAAAALLLQVAFIYVFTGLKKTGATWNEDYTALALSSGTGASPAMGGGRCSPTPRYCRR